jgi:type IV secretory pathway VirB3-like protein
MLGDVMKETFDHLQHAPTLALSLLANLYQYAFVCLLMYVVFYTVISLNENAFFEAR